MKNPFSKKEIQNKINNKTNEISDCQIQLQTLQNELDSLNDAYDSIQSKMTEFYELYPDGSYVISHMLGEDGIWKGDKSVWKGDKRGEFEFDFPNEYANGIAALGSDSLDARDWICVEIGTKEKEIKSVNNQIDDLKSDIKWLNYELKLLD